MMSFSTRVRPEQIASFAFVIIAVSLWEWLVRHGIVSALFFPAPPTIAVTLWQWLSNGDLTPHLKATCLRLSVGGGCDCLAGLSVGLFAGWLPRLRRMLDPFIAAAHPLPKMAVLPLVMILFGIGDTSKIVLVAVAAFFPMVINTTAGVRQIPSLYVDVAHNYGAGAFMIFRRVIFPGSLPMILTGLRLALNTAFVITISTEIVAAQ